MGIDFQTIQSLRELNTVGAPDIVQELVALFKDSAPESIRKMKNAAEGGGVVSLIYDEAHTLKSSSANLGALKMSQICKDIELHKTNFDSVKLSEQLKFLAVECAQVLSELDEFLKAPCP